MTASGTADAARALMGWVAADLCAEDGTERLALSDVIDWHSASPTEVAEAAAVVIDCLAVALAAARSVPVEDVLSAIQDALTAMRAPDPPRPTGGAYREALRLFTNEGGEPGV